MQHPTENCIEGRIAPANKKDGNKKQRMTAMTANDPLESRRACKFQGVDKGLPNTPCSNCITILDSNACVKARVRPLPLIQRDKI